MRDPDDDLCFLNEESLTEESAPQSPHPPFDTEACQSLGKELAKSDADVKWKLGDWLAENEGRYPSIGPGEIPGQPALDIYTYAEEVSGLPRATLKELASIARRFSVLVRIDALSWTHHRVLAKARPSADETELIAWLEKAVEEKLSVAAFRKAIQSPVRKPVKAKSFLVTVQLDVWETLKDFADAKRSGVQKVAAEFLTWAMREEETQANRKLARKSTKERRREIRRAVGLRVARDYDPLGLRR